MNKVILSLFILLIVLTGCQESNTSEDKSAMNDDKLKSGIEALLNEDNYSLEIKYNGSEFIKANEYFTYRLLEVLTDDLAKDFETTWKESIIDNYSLTLKVKGYKEIRINTDLECLWFENEDKLYMAKGIKELWGRYIIKLIDGRPTYCDFEKTVFTEINEDVDGDKVEDNVLLFYDSDIRLKVNDDDIVIHKAPYYRPAFRSGKQYYNYSPLDSINLEYIRNLDLLMYTFESFSIHGPFTNVSFYKYKNGKINKIWSDFDISSQIKDINFDKGIVDILFPFANITYKAKLNNEELNASRLIISELESAGIKVDKKFIDSINENIISSGDYILFKDYDGDDDLELILLGEIDTVGASTPIRLSDRIIFILDLFPDRIECTDILLERDVDESKNPFEYFISDIYKDY